MILNQFFVYFVKILINCGFVIYASVYMFGAGNKCGLKRLVKEVDGDEASWLLIDLILA